jgi:hypothetical protein
MPAFIPPDAAQRNYGQMRANSLRFTQPARSPSART